MDRRFVGNVISRPEAIRRMRELAQIYSLSPEPGFEQLVPRELPKDKHDLRKLLERAASYGEWRAYATIAFGDLRVPLDDEKELAS